MLIRPLSGRCGREPSDVAPPRWRQLLLDSEVANLESEAERGEDADGVMIGGLYFMLPGIVIALVVGARWRSVIERGALMWWRCCGSLSSCSPRC